MRRLVTVLSMMVLLGGCGGAESTSQGESAGDDEYAGQGTRDAGSVGEQVSAEDVSELEKLREQVAMQCEDGNAPGLSARVDRTLRITAQNNPQGIVDLNQVDRAENIQAFVNGMAELLENCGAPREAERLRRAEYGSAVPG